MALTQAYFFGACRPQFQDCSSHTHTACNPKSFCWASFPEAATIPDKTTEQHVAVQDFADTSAPALMPIFQSAKGDTLLLLVRSTPVLLQSMPRPYVTSMMVPLLVRAADQGEPTPSSCPYLQAHGAAVAELVWHFRRCLKSCLARHQIGFEQLKAWMVWSRQVHMQ